MGFMTIETKIKLWKRAALFGAALIWGSSFIVVKNTVDVVPPIFLIAIRFTIATILLSFVFYKHLKKLNREYLKSGFVIGFLLFLAYTIQTIGITDTTPGKNVFLTAIYCVLVPFLFWMVNRNRPDRYHFIAAFLCIIGIGFVCLSDGLKIRLGDSLTLIGGFFYAAHMVAVEKLSKDRDPVLITITQFGYTAIFAWISSLLTEGIPDASQFSSEVLLGILYLAVFATAIALLLQNVGQKGTPPAAASIILSMEAVLGVLFSVIFYHEKVTLQLFIGFAFILIAIIISETKLSFLHKNKTN